MSKIQSTLKLYATLFYCNSKSVTIVYHGASEEESCSALTSLIHKIAL